ncbi:MAG: class III signal peptide-containing protein [Candidatus Diapherotrites archaeon]|nr:class III signal peptide-containing protein [Candidatus Diapherotrites archaeon]
MNRKAQGALEYLLIIGGAILVASIVISLMMQTVNPTTCATQDTSLDALCARFPTQATCLTGDPDGGSGDCVGDPAGAGAGDCVWSVASNACIHKAADTRTSTCFPCRSV